ncbi:MAG: rhomboid family intramembrane serine protease [Candidatus Aenigmarchaeota archaeon]|nr:rhomboid family intramembrane serine protease [Candidatus Aenigmarchaeota archaeon]
MIPIKDEDAGKGIPPATVSLIAINIAAFLLTTDRVYEQYGMVSADILKLYNIRTIVTSQFIHGDIAHLLFNMWPLLIFGKSVEKRLGKAKFIAFYIVAGVAAGFVNALFTPFSHEITVGASGAIAGVIGAHMALFPKNYILTFLPGRYDPFIHVPSYYWALFWLAVQLVYGIFSFFTSADIAYWAHVGGFLFGYIVFRKIRA